MSDEMEKLSVNEPCDEPIYVPVCAEDFDLDHSQIKPLNKDQVCHILSEIYRVSFELARENKFSLAEEKAFLLGVSSVMLACNTGDKIPAEWHLGRDRLHVWLDKLKQKQMLGKATRCK